MGGDPNFRWLQQHPKPPCHAWEWQQQKRAALEGCVAKDNLFEIRWKDLYPTDSVHHFMKFRWMATVKDQNLPNTIERWSWWFRAGLHYVNACVMLCRMHAPSGCEWKHPGSCKKKNEMPTGHAVTTGMNKQQMWTNWTNTSNLMPKLPKSSPFSSCKGS